MPEKEIASFKINYLQILDEKGNLLDESPPDLTPEQLKELYKKMVWIREIDRKSVNLQRQGRIATYAPMEGQEACQVGSAFCLNKEDWVFPAFREWGVFLMRGLTPLSYLFFFMGCEEDNRVPLDNCTFPISVPVASQLPIAVGCGMAMKLQKKKCAVVTYFSDGATSEGDFNEALNFATVYQTPNVFICQNNHWAISVPRDRQTAARTLAQKAIAYEMETIQVDGNDIFAVYESSRRALERARRGEGPTFLELVTYRMRMHTTADDPTRYQPEEELKKWEKRDPIKRFEIYLKKLGLIDDGFKKSIEEKADSFIHREVDKAEKIIQSQDIESIFQYTYETMPEHLREQLEELKKYAT